MDVKGTDIYLTRGDSEGILVRFNNYDLTEEDKVEMTVRKSLESEKVLHKVALINEENTAYIGIEPKDTEELGFGEYVYDVQVTFKDGTVKTVVKPSKFFLRGEVTYD